MALQKLLVANRGEIAIRVIRAASDLGIATLAVHPEDDAASLHTRVADAAHQLRARGVKSLCTSPVSGFGNVTSASLVRRR